MLKYKTTAINQRKTYFTFFFLFFFSYSEALLKYIKNTQILLKNQHAATATLFLRKVSGIVVVYESGINLPC